MDMKKPQHGTDKTHPAHVKQTFPFLLAQEKLNSEKVYSHFDPSRIAQLVELLIADTVAFFQTNLNP